MSDVGAIMRLFTIEGVFTGWSPGLEQGPYPRNLDTVGDYAAVGSVAARRAS